jgi:hypothetical protein
MMEVIMPAAWKAMFLDGYAWSVGYPLSCPLDSCVAGGICALCKRHSVVLFAISM